MNFREFKREPSTAVVGALWMLWAALAFSGMAAGIRYLANDGVHPLITGFARSALGFVFMLPWILRAGAEIFRTKQHGLLFGRGILSAIAQALYFIAVGYLPMADAVSLTFTAPLFATLLAALFLGEALRLRRSIAMLIGFGGVLIILRPGYAEITWMTATPLLAAVGIAGIWILVKKLSATEPAERIVLYMIIYTIPFTLIPALFVWTTPAWSDVPALVGTALCANLGQFAMTRAYAAGDASAVFPYDFARLPFTALLAFLLFAQEPVVWTWVGGGVIFASSAYITHREARLRRAAATQPER